MSAPVFRADAAALADLAPGDEVTVDGPQAHHAVTVQRLGPGEALDLVDGAGRRIAATLVRGSKQTMTVQVTAVTDEVEPTPRLVLVQALAKGDRDLQAIEAATELGVAEVIPWEAERSIVRVRPERAAKFRAKWQATLDAAAKQSRRAHWPELAEPMTSAQVAERIARETNADPAARWCVLHESADQRWDEDAARTWRAASSLTVVVGPEGGITDAERDRFRAAGAQPLRLGQHVLRSSSAGPAALAALCAVTGRWS